MSSVSKLSGEACVWQGIDGEFRVLNRLIFRQRSPTADPRTVANGRGHRLKLLEAPLCGREPPRGLLNDSVVFGWILGDRCEPLHPFDVLMTLGEGGRGASPS